MKDIFKKKKKELQKPAPRPIEDIKRVYGEIAAKVADAQYQVFVYSKQVEQLNNILMHLNQEAAERKQLDSQTAKPEEEAKNG